MNQSCPGAPATTWRNLLTCLLMSLWLWLGYSLSLLAVAGIRQAALWQGAVCVLASGPLLLGVIGLLSIPKKIIRVAPAVYRALGPTLALSQYILPWVGWSALIWWMNRSLLTPLSALETGAVLAIFSYASGFLLVLLLRPRAASIEITQTEVTLPDLPLAYDGYRILHISDIHGGSRLALASAADRLAIAKSLAPDLIVFTGDLASRAEHVTKVADALGRLRARDGLVAVLGNHDHWIGEDKVANALAKVGFTVLGNEHLMLTQNGNSVYLVGVKDPTYLRQDDLPAALRGVPEQATVIILSHSPDIVLNPLASRSALILSGHTHGGQMVFPWIGPLYAPTRLGRRRMSGLQTVEGRLLYINRGLGEVFPPMRLNCPPELAMITLRKPL